MFRQFVRNTTEGVIRTEIGHGSLQRQGTAPAGYSGTPTERSVLFSLLFIYLLEDAYFSECAVPMDFF